ncbi:hypothetical protein LB505_006303 [Fusarium chuoi]|nr:hypothetical protein LB505_006303 [Fusarium chuoi]
MILWRSLTDPLYPRASMARLRSFTPLYLTSPSIGPSTTLAEVRRSPSLCQRMEAVTSQSYDRALRSQHLRLLSTTKTLTAFWKTSQEHGIASFLAVFIKRVLVCFSIVSTTRSFNIGSISASGGMRRPTPPGVMASGQDATVSTLKWPMSSVLMRRGITLMARHSSPLERSGRKSLLFLRCRLSATCCGLQETYPSTAASPSSLLQWLENLTGDDRLTPRLANTSLRTQRHRPRAVHQIDSSATFGLLEITTVILSIFLLLSRIGLGLFSFLESSPSVRSVMSSIMSFHAKKDPGVLRETSQVFWNLLL